MQDADGEMGFAHADGAGEEQATSGGGGGIAVNEAARHEVGSGERAIRAGETGFVAVQRAVLVARGDGGAVEEAGGALLDLALAGFDGASAVGFDDGPHTHAAAPGTE